MCSFYIDMNDTYLAHAYSVRTVHLKLKNANAIGSTSDFFFLFKF